MKNGTLLCRAWDIIKSAKEIRGSDLGWELWGETTECPNRGTGSQRHNKFCRPAGKLLKRLKTMGCVREVWKESCTMWAVTEKRPK